MSNDFPPNGTSDAQSLSTELLRLADAYRRIRTPEIACRLLRYVDLRYGHKDPALDLQRIFPKTSLNGGQPIWVDAPNLGTFVLYSNDEPAAAHSRRDEILLSAAEAGELLLRCDRQTLASLGVSDQTLALRGHDRHNPQHSNAVVWLSAAFEIGWNAPAGVNYRLSRQLLLPDQCDTAEGEPSELARVLPIIGVDASPVMAQRKRPGPTYVPFELEALRGLARAMPDLAARIPAPWLESLPGWFVVDAKNIADHSCHVCRALTTAIAERGTAAIGISHASTDIPCKSDDPMQDGTPREGAAGRPAKGKRPARGKSGQRLELISFLTRHHQYENGSVLKLDPIGCRELAELAGVSGGRASKFFRDEFQGHRAYKNACRNSSKLAGVLKHLNGEIPAHVLLVGDPAGRGDD